MNIEFHQPAGLVKPWLIEHMRNQLVELHHAYPELTRANVAFRKKEGYEQEMVCELDMPVFGSSLYIHRGASTVEEAVREVIQELKSTIEARNALRYEPPDSITSSISIEDETDLS